MAENKTKPTEASVAAYFAAIADETRRRDCETLARLMEQATGQPPTMWGPAIVGFGSYHYTYESGREGDMCLVGFASRKGDISLYGLKAGPGHEALLQKLGRHKTGKGCLYLKGLQGIDLQVLAQLVAEGAAATKRGQG
jgi:hypothetical protein